jgi:hypothetical protein
MSGALVANAQTRNTSTTKPVSEADELAIRSVENVHGTAGPFAVAGYRMGARAMEELGLLKGSFAVGVSHDAPAEVQWSCIVDGLQAATGASLGKLNLRMNVVDSPSAVRSVVINKESGAQVVFHLQDGFLKRFLNVPVPDLAAAGKQAMGLKDDEIFTVEIVGAKPKRPNPFKRNSDKNQAVSN